MTSDRSQTGGPTSPDDATRRASEAHDLASAALALMRCQREEDVHEVICDFLVRLLPGAIVIVNEATPDLGALITRKIGGADETLIGRVTETLGLTIVGQSWAVLPGYKERVLGESLSKIPGGLVEITSGQMPGAVAVAVSKLLGLRDVYTMGIGDFGETVGNLLLFTRATEQSVSGDIIESLARHGYSALVAIRKARELEESAESNALLLNSMVEALALFDVINGPDGRPVDYRYVDVNPAYERMTGLSSEELIGRTLLETWPTSDGDWFEQLGTVAETGEALRLDDHAALGGRHFGIVIYVPRPGQVAAILSDITERAQAESAARESRRRFEAMVESLPVAVVLTQGPEERTQYINPGFVRMFGYTSEDIPEISHWWPLAYPDETYRADVMRQWAALTQAESGAPDRESLETIVTCKDGSKKAVSWEYINVGDMNYSLGLDITEQREARAELERSRDMLVGLTDQVPGVVYQYRLNPDGSSSFPFSSRGMFDIYEVTPEEVKEDATVVFGRLHPEDSDYVSGEILESARTLGHFHVEFRVILPQQGLRWRLSNAIPQRTDDGGTMWYGIISDITEQKLLEIELRDSEARLKRAQHYAHIGSWSWDIKTNTLDWSDEMFSLFGLDKATFTGSLPDVIASAIHPDDRAEVERVNTVVASGGDPEPLEYRIVMPDGAVRVVRAEAGELQCDADGKPWVLSGTVQDITERKLAEAKIIELNEDLERRVQERTEELSAANEELLEANARLDEATRAKSDFLASMSHELRTPLNSIIGFSDILVRGMAGPLLPEQEKQVGMINASGKHLLELVNEVLDLSAVEAGKMRIEAVPLDVAPLVHSVVDSLLPMAESKGLELSWTVADEAASVTSDQTRLGQVLFNLVGNAVKFTSEGSVRVSADRVGDEIVFAIVDTGRGIPPGSVHRVFDDFYQVERGVDAKTEGTGLGLTVSKRLMEMMGGSIDVVSELGVGSTFTVRLPADGA